MSSRENGVLILALLIGAGIFLSPSEPSKTQTAQMAASSAQDAWSTLQAGISVSAGWVVPDREGNGWIEGAVTNRNSVAVKNVKIRCEGYLNSGSALEQYYTAWQVLQPGSASLFRFRVGSDLSDRIVARCTVVGADLAIAD